MHLAVADFRLQYFCAQEFICIRIYCPISDKNFRFYDISIHVPQICPTWSQSGVLFAKIWHPCVRLVWKPKDVKFVIQIASDLPQIGQIMPSQNVLKLILKSPKICPIRDQSDPIYAKYELLGLEYVKNVVVCGCLG